MYGLMIIHYGCITTDKENMIHLKKWWWTYWSFVYIWIAVANVFFGWGIYLELIQFIWLAPMGVWAFYLTWKSYKNENVKD